MAGSYGSETLHNGRYRLSFTVGGLLAPQGRIIASLFVKNGCPAEDAVSGADSSPLAGEVVGEGELGERILQVRRQAIDDNVLSIRTQSANARVVSEVLKRLSTLTEEETRFLADVDTSANDCQALMWVAMCRYYALIGEFATEVVRDHYLMGLPTVTREDYDRFIQGKAMWHEELEELSPATSNKLRSNVFKAMSEAGLVERRSDTLLPSLLGGSVAGILEDRPESFRFFPMSEG
ncbi:hypothetical protein BW12_09220 [Bifidobacterium sp. UTCIF-3]|uniref:DUF1819 family protein n=1 Tax=unclassified Bifidobacterium TaxID=2608897 RepID=UPI001128E7DC|nr:MULTISPECIES: DUF1819 family protein [unclassified Bifidobacterium]TPF77721.1 hypothetical protein BW09_08380 [Bifidobacterium sp. UTCIF-1]TPF80102.1 hypothetical protein BW08_06170 [Bifidobacterium sp. UTCIF-24]TPF81550.1 hypothetical protein BW12_09220 [Bifidobacterium sp. UTCIF-3]TPF83759.1 hypothetical protein BW07_08380 [Bifidobacterium sp. UTCIF-36]